VFSPLNFLLALRTYFLLAAFFSIIFSVPISEEFIEQVPSLTCDFPLYCSHFPGTPLPSQAGHLVVSQAVPSQAPSSPLTRSYTIPPLFAFTIFSSIQGFILPRNGIFSAPSRVRTQAPDNSSFWQVLLPFQFSDTGCPQDSIRMSFFSIFSRHPFPPRRKRL